MALADRIAKAEETQRASQEIIEKERRERLAKTERLRTARLAMMPQILQDAGKL